MFSGAHVVAVLAKILLEEAPRLRALRPELPEALDALVARMLSKDRRCVRPMAARSCRSSSARDIAGRARSQPAPR